MMPSIEIRLVLAVCVPFLGALGVLIARKHPNIREGVSFIAATTTFLAVLSLISAIHGAMPIVELFSLIPGISVSLRVDGMSLLFALVASFLWMIAVFYSVGYMRGLNEHAQTRFNVSFALAIFGAMGVAFSNNLFTLFLFYEIVSITTYPLVAHHQDEEGYAGGKKYIAYLTAAAKFFLLPAIVGIFMLAGSLDFATNIHAGIIPKGAHRILMTVLYVLCILGFAKNGLMPLHGWLPGAMVAPTPVSALLHAVAVVKVGVFATVRVMLYVFGTDTMQAYNLGIPTAYFVSFTILAASIIALSKDDLKARLAYSTVSQLAYVILGAALITPDAVSGGLLQIASHAFAKITLFFCAGAIFVATHRKKISELDGLGRVMPFTFAAFAVASLSMIGVPPAGGFAVKWRLLLGTMTAGQPVLLAVLLVSTLLNAAYFIPITIRAFFGKPAEANGSAGIREADLRMVIPLCITAVLSLAIGFYPDIVTPLFKAVLQ
ncbi:MAG: monovalent cation/H+ antiporter subunit D family protein [Spirochaetes bacterium]|nr:monovalent cation/H+ antiporter subunit D family protein [Spirochaetota bacterium]